MERNYKIFGRILGICLLALIGGLVGTASASAEQVYIVKKGDNLWKIARMHNTSVAQIMTLNRLSSDALQPGNKLMIPNGASVPQPAEASQPSRGLDLGLANARLIVNRALEFRGTPYRYGGTTSKGFDCSGFVRFIFAQYGISLPHHSGNQASLGTHVEKDELTAGDLVFFKTGGAKKINHVGIYIDDDRFIHASTNKGITVSSLNEGTYARCYTGARRILKTD